MSSAVSPSSLISQVDREIADAERLIHESVQSIIAALRRGEDAAELEEPVRQMRTALEQLRSQRRKLVRAMHEPQSRSGTAA